MLAGHFLPFFLKAQQEDAGRLVVASPWQRATVPVWHTLLDSWNEICLFSSWRPVSALLLTPSRSAHLIGMQRQLSLFFQPMPRPVYKTPQLYLR